MKSFIVGFKSLLKHTRLPILREWIGAYFAWRYRMAERRKYRRWIASGRSGPPPPLYKQMVVRSVGARFGIGVLIETGTFEGQMIESVKRDFSRICTIELDPDLSSRASEHFRDEGHITAFQGDSGQVLPRLLATLNEPALFWLDAHYSGGATARGDVETPIMTELAAIAAHASHREHVILIDDAREFKGGAYPTIEELKHWALKTGYDSLNLEHDIIRIFNLHP